MEFLKSNLVKGSLSDAEDVSKFGLRHVDAEIDMSQTEKNLLVHFIMGYYLVQKSGEFVDYQKLPYWKYLKIVPPIPSVVGAAILSETIGRKLLEETTDHEHILRSAGKLSFVGVKNLANLISGTMAYIEDTPLSDKHFDQIKDKLKSAINNWRNVSQNKI